MTNFKVVLITKTYKIIFCFKENKDEAIQIYKLGIEEFIKGLDIDLDDEDQGRLANIQEKMRGNMVMALERVEELSKS